MKTAVERCPKCGRFYYPEQGPCPRCTSIADLRKMAKSIGSQDTQDRNRFRRILLIAYGILLLITAIALSIAYFTRGWQKMAAGISPMLPWVGLLLIWLFAIFLVFLFALDKGKSALWGLFALLFPISPLYTIPYLWLHQPRGTNLGWFNTLLASLAPSAVLMGLYLSIFAWTQ